MEKQGWNIEYAGEGISRITLLGDKYAMNWVGSGCLWGEVVVPEGIDVKIEREITGRGFLREEYILKNVSGKKIAFKEGEAEVAVPFNDGYTDFAVCMTERCHAHIWCGGERSYVLALRMGGEAPHLGLCLTRGSIASYSVEKHAEGVTNTRGDFYFNLKEAALEAGEEIALSWELFSHGGKEDFKRILRESFGFKEIELENYVIFKGEKALMRYGEKWIEIDSASMGERRIELGQTYARVLVTEPFDVLLEKRVKFICENQQNKDKSSPLYGAYLIYDNETGEQFYSSVNDYNGGRERVGMGVVVAMQLQRKYDRKIDESLRLYEEYVLRELYCEAAGVVANDIGHDTSYKRYYNFPWVAQFFAELYYLRKDAVYLERAYKAIKAMYEIHVVQIYPIGMEISELYGLLLKENRLGEAEDLAALLEKHCEYIAKIGFKYPKSEVDYEQSIVAPAVNMLLQCYEVTKKERYLQEAKRHMRILELFSFEQPDWHLNETAIRHWDDYWFGKYRMWGDTFPHYWSSLSGECYMRYARIAKDERYAAKGERALRGTLGMIFPDGRASCAYVYPKFVSGEKADKFDMWANDQDWCLYYYGKFSKEQLTLK